LLSRPSLLRSQPRAAAHRDAYHAEIGISGKVAAVRRLKTGVSVVMHLEGPAAERALNLEIATTVAW
jgi:hypothetical protein